MKLYINLLLNVAILSNCCKFTVSATEVDHPCDSTSCEDIHSAGAHLTNDDESLSESSQETPLSRYDIEILTAYEALCDYIYTNNIPTSISIDAFYTKYLESSCESLDAFLSICKDELSQITTESNPSHTVFSSTPTGDNTWFYNTSTKVYKKPNYSKYNLLNIVQPGDIIYEDAGGSGLTGHCTIVEGIYYNSYYGQYYIRIIEAITYLTGSIGEGDGVCRGILDDDRYDAQIGTILRVSDATSDNTKAAISFCVSQIGKDYEIDLWGHSTSESEDDWYCSELIWAAYYLEGIDLESSRGIAVTPQELLDSTSVEIINVSEIGTPSISVRTTSQTSASVSWSSVSGATKYYIYRSTSANGTYSLVAETTATQYSDANLTAGGTYYYRVAAGSTSGIGNKSSVKGVKLTFTSPLITTIYSPSNESVYLEWSTIYNATGYMIYRAPADSSTYEYITSTTRSYYTDSSCTAGTTYLYKIAAYNANSTSERSSYRVCQPCVVEKPTIYFTRANSSSSITIKWTNVPNAVNYYVYRSTSPTGTYTLVTSTTKTSYTNTGLASGTSYYYKIRAYYSSEYSDYSAYATETTSS